VSVILTRIRVELTLVCRKHTLRVEINLVRHNHTYTCQNQTLRVEITLIAVVSVVITFVLDKITMLVEITP
jgi:membrane-bound inhibitor of C-type lysozyme